MIKEKLYDRRNFSLSVIFISVVLLVVILSCTRETAPVTKDTISSGGLAQEPLKQSWEENWEKTINLARREGKAVIYSGSSPDVRQAQRKAFKERFGITLEIVPGSASVLAAKIIAEYKANIPYVDVYSGGGSTLVTMLKPAGVLAPLDSILALPEVLDPKVWFENKIPFVDKDHTAVMISLAPAVGFVINTSLVKDEEMNSYQDLLDPKWKGKIIVADPTMPPGGDQWFTTYMYTGILTPDYMKALVKQEPFISRDRRMAAEWLSRGKYAISIGTGWVQFYDFYKAGAPIKYIIPEEGDYLAMAAGAFGLIKNPPHPNAAKLFINWALSKEGAAIFSEAYDRQSTRIDISTEKISAHHIRNPKVKYIHGDTEELYLKAPEYRKMAEEIFKPVLPR